MPIALIDGDLKQDIGHTWTESHGYLKMSVGQQKDILLHRWVVERTLGRKLKSYEHVHHINLDKTDNRRSNLLVCTNSYHIELHKRQRVQDLGFDFRTHKYCWSCKICHPFSEFSTSNSTSDGFHVCCRNATNQYRKEKGFNRSKFDWKARLHQQYRRLLKQHTKREVCWLPKEGRGL